MTEEDLDGVERIEQKTFPEPWSRACFRRDMNRPTSLALVAISENEVVGYAVAWPEQEVHVANIAVTPEFRQQGIGRLLLERIEEFGRQAGARSVYLEVRKSNSRARAFYRRLGFIQTYTREGYYSNGEDAIIMEKDIAPAP